jgi:ADP-ribose pyrophosphatase YjhB (NUDIX family)
VLLTRRAHAPWNELWCAPGGFCEEGEHPIQMEREVLEETGLRVDVTGYIGVWIDEYADEPGRPGVAVINVAYYSAVPVEGERAEFDRAEVSDVRWFAWEELPPDLAPPGTLEAVLAAVRAETPMPDRVTPWARRVLPPAGGPVSARKLLR